MKHLIRDSSRWLKVVPELTFYDDPAERAAAWKRAFKTFRWRYAVAIGLIMGLISIFGPVSTTAHGPSARHLHAAPHAICD